jgi:hypothetical protein
LAPSVASVVPASTVTSRMQAAISAPDVKSV